MKIRPVGAELFPVEGLDAVVTFRNYVNAPKNESGKHRCTQVHLGNCHRLSEVRTTRSVNKVMRLIQYNSVLTFKLQIEFVPFKIVPLGGYTPPETFPLFVATLVVANWNRF